MAKLKTDYKYIKFVQINVPNRKTKYFECIAKRGDIHLGMVKYYPGWSQYCFFPVGDTIFNRTCLSDINDFIQQLTWQRNGQDPRKTLSIKGEQ